MCMDAATQQRFDALERQLQHQEGLLKEAEDCQVLRHGEHTSMIAGLAERYSWTLEVFGVRICTVSLEPTEPRHARQTRYA